VRVNSLRLIMCMFADCCSWGKKKVWHQKGTLSSCSFRDWNISIFTSSHVLFVCPSVRPSVCPFVYSFVTKLVNAIFWKWMNRICCKLAQAVYGQGDESVNFWGQKVKGQRDMTPHSRPLWWSWFSLVLNPSVCHFVFQYSFNPLASRGNYSATPHNMK